MQNERTSTQRSKLSGNKKTHELLFFSFLMKIVVCCCTYDSSVSIIMSTAFDFFVCFYRKSQTRGTNVSCSLLNTEVFHFIFVFYVHGFLHVHEPHICICIHSPLWYYYLSVNLFCLPSPFFFPIPFSSLFSLFFPLSIFTFFYIGASIVLGRFFRPQYFFLVKWLCLDMYLRTATNLLGSSVIARWRTDQSNTVDAVRMPRKSVSEHIFRICGVPVFALYWRKGFDLFSSH